MPVDVNLIERYAGRINSDIISGWETGLKGRVRIGNRLIDRSPPEHLTGYRLTDWYCGQEAAVQFLKTRQTHFCGKTVDGIQVSKVRQGWVSRPPVIRAMDEEGVRGDVIVHYVEDGKIIREHCCMI